MTKITDRDVAVALVFELVKWRTGRYGGEHSFSMLGFYDEDHEFIQAIADRLNLQNTKSFRNRLVRIVRRLVQYEVLHARMMGTQKYYIDEPAKQRNYWLRPGKAELIRKGQTEYTMSPEGEVSFLLRHAYPEPDST